MAVHVLEAKDSEMLAKPLSSESVMATDHHSYRTTDEKDYQLLSLQRGRSGSYEIWCIQA